jgi:hypothetical protein
VWQHSSPELLSRPRVCSCSFDWLGLLADPRHGELRPTCDPRSCASRQARSPLQQPAACKVGCPLPFAVGCLPIPSPVARLNVAGRERGDLKPRKTPQQVRQRDWLTRRSARLASRRTWLANQRSGTRTANTRSATAIQRRGARPGLHSRTSSGPNARPLRHWRLNSSHRLSVSRHGHSHAAPYSAAIATKASRPQG